MIREIAARLTRSLAERRAARSRVELPVKVTFVQGQPGLLMPPAQWEMCLFGKSADLSSGGIGFIVPSIRIKENYLVSPGRLLNVEIEAFGKKIAMRVIGKRYEEIGLHHSTERYLIGAEIVEMSDNDQRNFTYLLKNYRKLSKAPSRSLELGLD